MNESATGLQLREGAQIDALLPDHGSWPWWLAAAVLVLSLAAVVLLRKRRKPGVTAVVIREQAYREAMAALEGSSPADAREAAVRCSLVLRRYLATAAADPALFETHEEFLARGDALGKFTPAARAAAASGFSILATLKYAPRAPVADAGGILADSRALLESLHQGFAA
jgi:hypothetical protein